MNRYPIWKYVVIVIAMLVGALYTLPNFFGEAPAVQVSPGKATVKVDTGTQRRVEDALKAAGIAPAAITFDGNSIKVRLDTGDEQLKAKDAIQRALIPDPSDPPYVVALNLLSRSPSWLSAIGAAPMYLGLDLRGGVHFMLQVDMEAALTRKVDSLSGDMRTALREKNVRHSGISRNEQTIEVMFRDAATREAATQTAGSQHRLDMGVAQPRRWLEGLAAHPCTISAMRCRQVSARRRRPSPASATSGRKCVSASIGGPPSRRRKLPMKLSPSPKATNGLYWPATR